MPIIGAAIAAAVIALPGKPIIGRLAKSRKQRIKPRSKLLKPHPLLRVST